MELYLAAKLRITMNQTEDDYYIFNDDDELLKTNLPPRCHLIPAGLHSTSQKLITSDAEKIYFSDKINSLNGRELLCSVNIIFTI